MDFLSRINAVLRHENPAQIPFAPYDNLVPRGEFARELQNRGMGRCCPRSTIFAEMPHVSVETRMQDGGMLTTYHTPEGDASKRVKTAQTAHGLTLKWYYHGGRSLIVHLAGTGLVR